MQRHIEEDTRDILHVAGARMDVLMKDRSHFLHQGQKIQQDSKVPLIQQKKVILDQLCRTKGGTNGNPTEPGCVVSNANNGSMPRAS